MRGKGLLNAVVIDDDSNGSKALDVCLKIKIYLNSFKKLKIHFRIFTIFLYFF